MVRIEDLRRENARLKAREEIHKDFAKMEYEKRQLMKENARLRHPERYNLMKAAGSFAKRGTNLIAGAAKKYSTAQKSLPKGKQRKLKPMKVSDWI